MRMVFRVLSVLIGLMSLLTGLNWIVNPAAAAEGLGMELMTGLGASTQIGDLSDHLADVGGLGLELHEADALRRRDLGQDVGDLLAVLEVALR